MQGVSWRPHYTMVYVVAAMLYASCEPTSAFQEHSGSRPIQTKSSLRFVNKHSVRRFWVVETPTGCSNFWIGPRARTPNLVFGALALLQRSPAPNF